MISKASLVFLISITLLSCQKGGEKFPPAEYSLIVSNASYFYDGQAYTVSPNNTSFEVVKNSTSEIDLQYSSPVQGNNTVYPISKIYFEGKDAWGAFLDASSGNSFDAVLRDGRVKKGEEHCKIEGTIIFETIHTYENPLPTDTIVEAIGDCTFKRK